MSAQHRAGRRGFIAAACYLAAGVAGAVAAARLASPDNRTAALVVGGLAGVVVVWLGSLFAMERVSRKAGDSPVRAAKDPYYANLAAFVYGRGGNTRRLVVVLIVVIAVGLAIDLLATLG